MAFCLAQKNSGLMCQTKQIEPEQKDKDIFLYNHRWSDRHVL